MDRALVLASLCSHIAVTVFGKNVHSGRHSNELFYEKYVVGSMISSDEEDSSVMSVGESPTIVHPLPPHVSMSGERMYADPPHVEIPYIDDVSPRNITAVVGQSTILNCRVQHLGDRTVLWMRKRDFHILTIDVLTYTSDERFGVKHPEASDEWNLQIKNVQTRDAGIYECQVNMEPWINLAIRLNVEVPQAKIWGPKEVYVKKGSTISLTCSVNIHLTPPSSVLWYQGSDLVYFSSPRVGVSIETEKTEAGTTSKLLVTKAALTDSGNYTCVPSNANPASVYVHVLNGELPFTMVHRIAYQLISSTSWALLSLLVASLR